MGVEDIECIAFWKLCSQQRSILDCRTQQKNKDRRFMFPSSTTTCIIVPGRSVALYTVYI